MAVSDLIKRLTKKAEEADASFEELAVKAAEGEDVSEQAIEKACLSAGQPISAFTERIELLLERKRLWDVAFGRDWEGEISVATKKWREAHSAHESTKAEVEALIKDQKAYYAEAERLRGLKNRLTKERDEALLNTQDTLRKTGSAGDWREVGPPEPRLKRAPNTSEMKKRGYRVG